MKKVIVGLVVLMMFLLRTLSFAEGKSDVGRIDIEQAVEIVKKEVSGKVMEAESENEVYEIKIMTDSGERIKFKIDPKDGNIIRKGKIIKGLSKGLSKPEANEVQR